MALSLQVAYPTTDGTTFDFDYYMNTHMPLVGEHMGATMASAMVAKGLGGPAPGAPSPFYAIATMTFEDQAAMDAAMAKAGPVIADIPNFTDTQPMIMVGEVAG